MITAFARDKNGKIEEVDYEKLPEDVRQLMQKRPGECSLRDGKLYGKTANLVTEEEFEGWTAFYQYYLHETELSARSIKELLRLMRSGKFENLTYWHTSNLYRRRGFTVEGEDFFADPRDIPPGNGVPQVIDCAQKLGVHEVIDWLTTFGNQIGLRRVFATWPPLILEENEPDSSKC